LFLEFRFGACGPLSLLKILEWQLWEHQSDQVRRDRPDQKTAVNHILAARVVKAGEMSVIVIDGTHE